MKINKESNVYTIIYIIVLVTVVGTALGYTSLSLKDRQQENMNADKMCQILASVHIVPEEGMEAETFSRYITAQYIVNAEGKKIDGMAFDINVSEQVKLPIDDRHLPVYEATVDDGSLKYILPVYGAGLWGPIWGYIALDSDASTVYGAYFAHQGETPGLGAEIAKTSFSDQFIGKHMFKGGYLIPVNVVKKGQKYTGGDYVDGISGGTITSKGVATMLNSGLRPYETFLKNIHDKK